MSSSPLRVVVAERPPLVFINNSSDVGLIYSGMLIDLWQQIVAASNGTLGQYQYYTSPSNVGGVLLDDGRWTGVVGELVYGRADVALFPLTRVQFRLDVIDATYSFLDQGLTLLVSNEVEDPGALSVLAPFEMTLWILLLCTVISIALLFWGLDAYGRWIRRKQAEALRASGVLSQKQADRIKRENWSSMLISFAAAAGAPERPSRSSWGVQVLYVAYCFFCLIVLSAYTANLTSFLAVRRASVNINSLQDIVSKNLLLAANVGSVTAAYFVYSQDTLAMQLGPHVRTCDMDTCLRWLRDGTVAAYVGDAPVLNYIAEQQPCDLATVGDTFGPGNLVIGLQRNSSLLPIINRVIQRFSEDGTLTSLRRAWFDDLSQCKRSDSQLDNSKLTIGQMLGAFVFLAMGVMVAFVTGTVENLKWCLVRGYRHNNNDEESHQSRDYSVFNRLQAALVKAQRKSLQAAHSHNSVTGCGADGSCPVCGLNTGADAAAALAVPDTSVGATGRPSYHSRNAIAPGEVTASQSKADFTAVGPVLGIGEVAQRLASCIEAPSPQQQDGSRLSTSRMVPAQRYQQVSWQDEAPLQVAELPPPPPVVAPRVPSMLVIEAVDRVGSTTWALCNGGAVPVPVVLPQAAAAAAAAAALVGRQPAAAAAAVPAAESGTPTLRGANPLKVSLQPMPAPGEPTLASSPHPHGAQPRQGQAAPPARDSPGEEGQKEQGLTGAGAGQSNDGGSRSNSSRLRTVSTRGVQLLPLAGAVTAPVPPLGGGSVAGAGESRWGGGSARAGEDGEESPRPGVPGEALDPVGDAPPGLCSPGDRTSSSGTAAHASPLVVTSQRFRSKWNDEPSCSLSPASGYGPETVAAIDPGAFPRTPPPLSLGKS